MKLFAFQLDDFYNFAERLNQSNFLSKVFELLRLFLLDSLRCDFWLDNSAILRAAIWKPFQAKTKIEIQQVVTNP